MDFLCKPLFKDVSDCSIEQDMKKCPFLMNIDKLTNFSFASLNFHFPSRGTQGPIFEDGPNFDLAFKLFHGKGGVVPLSENDQLINDALESEVAVPQFNPLPLKAASVSMSAFGPGGPFSFHSFVAKMQNKGLDSSKKNNPTEGDSSNHEALGNEWLKTGNCPIAKSYRAVSNVLPLMATVMRPPLGIKLKCPPAVVAARAALARTALVKTVRPQPLPAKILVIGALGIAVNIPLGVWREHTKKFSLPWFTAVHAAVPFIAMLRKSVVMPKMAMALTIAGSILGQMIGSRAERIRLKAKADKVNTVASANRELVTGYGMLRVNGGHCAKREITWNPLSDKMGKASSSPASVCF